MSGESKSGPFSEESSVGSDTLVKALRDAKQSDRVKAIVLRVDSPGGSALASDLIWREVATCDKPVVVSMGNVGGQRRLLHLDGGRQNLCRAGHAHRLDRRGRRQDGPARAVRQGRHQRRDDQPRQERRLVLGDRAVFRIASAKPGSG